MGLAQRVARKLAPTVNGWADTRWYGSPLGEAPRADPATYLSLAHAAADQSHDEIDAFERERGFAVDHEWLDELALHTQIVIKESRLCYQHGRILYAALRRYLEERSAAGAPHLHIVETGTARGFSSLCMARALSDAGAAGTITTFDVLPHDHAMYWNCIDDHEGPRTRAELLEPWRDLVDQYIHFVQGDTRMTLPKFRTGRVHFAYLDGAHTYDDVWAETRQVAPFQRPSDVIVYDDYTPAQFPGLVLAVDEICAQLGYDAVRLSAHDRRGYVVATKR